MFSDEDSDPFSREDAEKGGASDNIVIPPSSTIITRDTPLVLQERSPRQVVRTEVDSGIVVRRQNDVLFSDEEDIFDQTENSPRSRKRRSNTEFDSFADSFEQKTEPKPPKRKPSLDVVNDSFDEDVDFITSPAKQDNSGAADRPLSGGEAPLCDSFDISFDAQVELVPAPVKDDPFDDFLKNAVADAVKENAFDRSVTENNESNVVAPAQEPRVQTRRLTDSFDDSDNNLAPRTALADSFDDSNENQVADAVKEDSFDDDDQALLRIVPVEVPSFQRVTEEYTVVEEAIAALDEMAQQLKLAVALQKNALTSRNSGLSLFPHSFEGRHLASGSHLLLLNVENKSQQNLHGWQLTISSGSTDKETHVAKSRSIDLGHVPAGGKKCFEVLTYSQDYDPLLYEMELYRMFDIDGIGTAFRIPLCWTLFSSLNQLSTRQDDKILDCIRFVGSEHFRFNLQSSSFCIPIGLVRRLCGGNLDEYAFLTHLLKPSSIEVLSQTAVSLSVSISNSHSEPVLLSVFQESRNFVLKISVKDPLVRKTLKRDLQLYIILSVSKFSVQSNLDFYSIDQLYESIVSSF